MIYIEALANRNGLAKVERRAGYRLYFAGWNQCRIDRRVTVA
jgi:hypothetical protein